VNELWFKVDPGKEGIYRGQCAALCGRDHGFMPVVVDVRTPDDFKKWVEEEKAAARQAAAPLPAPTPLPVAAAEAPPAKTAQVLN
jgi:cytochrome c oxidase subunit 2